MVFDPNKFQRWSDGRAIGCNAMWNYTDTDTAIATLVAANFFDAVNELNPTPIMNVGDLIWLVASDVLDGEFAVVTDIDPHITVSVFDVVLGVGAVGTNNLAANAVTGAKMANDTITDTQVQDNALSSSSLALNTIQYAKVPVTAAQWNGMYAAPFLMIAAPGANNVIVIDQAMIEMEFVAAQFAAGGAVSLEYDTVAHAAGVLATTTVAGATVDGWAADTNHLLTGAIASGANASMANKGIYLSNDTAAFTTGDGTFNIHIWYHVVAVTP